jgi:hypothetical protein
MGTWRQALRSESARAAMTGAGSMPRLEASERPTTTSENEGPATCGVEGRCHSVVCSFFMVPILEIKCEVLMKPVERSGKSAEPAG